MFGRTKKAAKGIKDRTVQYGQKVVGFRDIQDGAAEIVDMVGELSDGKKSRKRQETFSNAVNRLNLNEGDIEGAYKTRQIQFYIWGVATAVAIGVIIFSAISGNFMQILAIFGFLALAVAQMFRNSFRCFQINRRDLCEPKLWLDHPGDWIPGGFRKAPPPRKGGDLSIRANKGGIRK